MKNTRAYIFNLVILILFNLLILLYIAVLLLPTSFWFTYVSLTNVSADKEIIMASQYIKPRKTILTYNDVLFCDLGKGPIRYSSNSSESLSSSHELRTSIWRYEGNKPSVVSACKMTSDITTHVLFGIEKTASVSSQLFIYKP